MPNRKPYEPPPPIRPEDLKIDTNPDTMKFPVAPKEILWVGRRLEYHPQYPYLESKWWYKRHDEHKRESNEFLDTPEYVLHLSQSTLEEI